jgi:hypothetical protein
MKRLKKILLWVAGVLFGFIALLVILGYLFEDKIHLMAIRELEKALNADIEVRDTDVSFLRNWPQVQVRLEGLTINPRGKHGTVDVIAAEDAIFKIGFWSIFTDNYKVHGVRLVEPAFNLTIDKNGDWNYADMFNPPADDDTTDDGSTDPVFELYSVRVDDGRFTYSDLRDGSTVRIDSIQLGMKGDFSAERSDIKTQFALHLDQWNAGRATWARNKHLAAAIVADVTFGEDEYYRLKSAEIDIAALKLAFEGGIGRDGSVFDLDLKFASSQNSFESFLSLLPGGLLDTGRDYEYSGNFVTKGWLKGKAGDGQSPDVHADYVVTDGSFHYVGIESKLTDVNMLGEFHFEDKDPTASHIDIKRFKAVLQEKTVTGNMTYANFKDPRLALALRGKLSLQDVRDFYPAFADSTQMSGLVQVDAQIEGRIADFKEKRHEAIKAFGGFKFQALRIEDPRLALPIENLTGQILLDNYRIEVTSLTGKVGHSDFNIKGIVTEYLPWFFTENATIKGFAELRCANMDLDEWFADAAAVPATAGTPATEETFTFSLPKYVDVELVAQIGKFKFAKFEATAMNGTCRLADQALTLNSLQMNTLDGAAEISGGIQVLDDTHCDVQIDGVIKNVDVNKTFRTFEQLAAFALVKENLYGIFSGTVHIAGRVDQNLNLDPQSLVSFGNVNIRECKLINFEPLEGLVGFVKLDELRHIEFSDITTDYRIGEEHFYIPKMSLKANRYSMVVVGKHGFDNTLDYKVYVELPRKDAKNSKNREVLDMVEVNQGDPIKIVIPVHITGTVDHPKYSLEGHYVAEKLDEQIKKEGEELKQAWHTEMQETWGASRDTNKVDDLIDEQRDPRDSAKVKGKDIFDKVKKPFDKLKKPFKSIGDRLGN